MKLSLLILFSTSLLAQSIATDGYGLIDKPEPFTTEQNQSMFEQGKQMCSNNCVNDFGTALGESQGVKAYSNCQSQCIYPEFSFLNLATNEVTIHAENPKDKNLYYIGLVYQCVEYARRWWMINNGITFGSIDSAHEIIYLDEGKNIRTNENFPLARSINGTARIAPKKGDLLVYYPDRNNPLWRHGHVAVVVDVDEQQGWIALAEENYNNKLWQNPESYSRKISLFKTNGYYQILDIEPGMSENTSGGLISGWIYPQTTGKTTKN